MSDSKEKILQIMYGTSLAYGSITNTFFNVHQPQLPNSMAVSNVLKYLFLTHTITKPCFDN